MKIPDGEGPDRNSPCRTCIVSRQSLPVDGLIRFVASPEGVVTPDLRRRLPVSGAYLTAPANSAQINLVLAWQEGQQRADTVDTLCSNAPVNIADTTFRCSNWIINP